MITKITALVVSQRGISCEALLSEKKHSLNMCIKCNWCFAVSSFIPYIPKTHSFTCAHKYEYILPVATDFPQNSDMYVDTVKQMRLVHSLEWHQMFKYTAVE